MLNLQQNLENIRSRISRAAALSKRSAEDIVLIGVTKTLPVEVINTGIRLGIRDIGENRVQEARQKFPELDGPVTRHLIGYLQRNKVKYAVKLFDMIQSVHSVALAEEINARCAKLNRQMPVLIQVNTSDEDSKSGCKPSEALPLLKAVDRLSRLSARGFMTIALLSEDPEAVRPCFKLLKGIYDEAQHLSLQNGRISHLSMGMSSDFDIAIEEGATMIRIGTAIFGARPA